MATTRTVAPPSEDVQLSDFERLRRFVVYHAGDFTLGLVRVNDPRRRDGVLASLTEALARDGVRMVRLDFSGRHPDSLLDELRRDPQVQAASSSRAALAILGLDHLIETRPADSLARPFSVALNLERDAFRAEFRLPITIWLTDHAMDRLFHHAPDFADWFSGIFRFTAQPREATLREVPEQPAQREPEPSPVSEQTALERIDLLESRRVEFEREGPPARPRLAEVLREMGQVYAALPEFHYRQSAVSHLAHAARLFREIGDGRRLADALSELAEVHYWIARYPDARNELEEALSIYRAIGDRPGEANAIRSLGDVHRMLAEYEAMRRRYEEALHIYRAIGARQEEADVLFVLGDTYQLLGDYESAQWRYTEALPIYRDVKDWLGEARALESLGNVHQRLEDYETARLLYEDALSTYQRVGNWRGEARAILHLGHVHRLLDESEDLRRQYEDAHSNYRKTVAHQGEANTLLSLGDVHLSLAEYEAARRRYEEARYMFSEIGDRLGEAGALVSLGDIHRIQDRYGPASSLYGQAQVIYEQLVNRYGLAGVFRRRGLLADKQGQAVAAIDAYQQAERLYTEIGVERWAQDCRDRIAALQQPA